MESNQHEKVNVANAKEAQKRLAKEALSIFKEPLQGIVARYDNDDIFTWHFLILGPDGTPFKGGIYHGLIKFPAEYPNKPPSIYMITPSGRFKTDTRLCLSMSDFHPDHWNPNWTLSSLLYGILFALLDDEDLIGTVDTDDTQKRMYARESLAFNSRSPAFLKLFPEYTQIVHALQLTRSNSSHGSAEDLIRSSTSSTDSPTATRTPPVTNIGANNTTTNETVHKSEPIPIVPNTSSTSTGTGGTRSKRSNSSGVKPAPTPQKVIPQPPLAQSTEAVLSPDNQPRGSPKQSRSPLQTSQSLDLDGALKEFETANGRRRLERDIAAPLLREIARWTGTDESKVVLPVIEIKSVDLGPEDRVSASNNNEDGEGSLTVPNNNTTPTNSPSKSPSPHSESPLSVSADLKLEVRAKMRISFANWHFLQPNKIEGTPEQQREKAKDLVVKILDRILSFAYQLHKVRIVFSEIDLSHTESSMRAIFNGTNGKGQPIHRENEVEILNLTGTQTSARSLLSLYRLTNLRELYLDHCYELKKSGEKVFSLLSKKEKIQALEVLSVVDTSEVLDNNWLTDVGSRCPRLKTVYFTRKKGTKALGWQDLILMQTMRNPQLLPCGHIGDKESTVSLSYCSLDRESFRLEELVPLNPSNTKLSKGQSAEWSATVVDACREPLDSKCLYHVPCGEFYNYQSIVTLYNLDCGSDHVNLDAKFVESLKTKQCIGCKKKLTHLRVCFPNSAEHLDKPSFDTLEKISVYGVQDVFIRK
jgi:ubiquitin-conjugating enzyme E2 J2